MSPEQLAHAALELASQEFRIGVISATDVIPRANTYYEFLINPGFTTTRNAA